MRGAVTVRSGSGAIARLAGGAAWRTLTGGFGNAAGAAFAGTEGCSGCAASISAGADGTAATRSMAA